MKRKEAIEARRQAIFQAAGQLIRENRSTEFSMPVLAKRAGLSNATTYNIIGNKATVLYQLLDTCVEELLALARRNDDRGMSTNQALAAADAAISYFVSDADFYRPLMQHLLGVTDIGTRPSFMSKALRYWRISLGESRAATSVGLPCRRTDIAAIIHTLFIGTINAWIYGDLDVNAMRSIIKDGIELVLRGAAALQSES